MKIHKYLLKSFYSIKAIPFFFLLFCPLLYSPLNAQTEDDPDDDFDVGFSEPQDIGYDFSYPLFPWIERQAVVLYESQAQAYIRLSGGNASGFTTLYCVIQGETTSPTAVTVANEGHILTDLPLNRLISLYAYDEADDLVKIGELSTYRHEEEVIPLPMHLYRPLSHWLYSPEPGSNLYSFVAGLGDAHYLEKASFIQQFFYGGHPLPDDQIGLMPSAPSVSIGQPCLCRPLQLMVKESAIPIDRLEMMNSEDGNYLPDYKTGYETTQYFGSGDRGKRWYAYSYEGAGKYQQVWIETARCVGGNRKMEIDNLSPDGPGSAAGPEGGNRSMLSYVFACIGLDDFRPQDCPCERPRRVRACWRYAAEALVSVDLRSGFCWNGRGIWGGATDVVVLASGYSDLDSASMPMPLASNIITAGAGCSMNFDEAKLAVNLFNVGLNVYKTIKLLGVSTPIGIAGGVFYANKAAKSIKDLFSDDYVQTSGSCGTVVTPAGILLDGCEFFDLEPNRTRVIVLMSNSRLIVEGYGRYHGTARVLSSYALSGTISRSDPDQTGQNCCSNGHGVYSLSAFYPGMNTANAQQWVRSNFIAAGLQLIPGLNLNISGEFGYRGGGERSDCRLVIVDGRSKEEASPATIQSRRLEAAGSILWLRNHPEEQTWRFHLMDAAGRMLYTSQGVGGNVILYDFRSAQIPAGVYFVQLHSPLGTETLRVAKPY